jgi:hypothetical protein
MNNSHQSQGAAPNALSQMNNS